MIVEYTNLETGKSYKVRYRGASPTEVYVDQIFGDVVCFVYPKMEDAFVNYHPTS